MCDYCGCRRSGPTAELNAEHERLLELGDIIYTARYQHAADAPEFAEFVQLLQMHSAKEEIGLFVHAKESTPLGDQIDQLCREHDDLREWLSDGYHGERVFDALRLLVTHIEDEEWDLFPHIFHALDPEQWDEIELAHRAIEEAWGVHDHSHAHPHDHDHDHPHSHDHV